jgi:hypothetical protein
MTPIRTSVNANVAVFAATAMSQAATRPTPPALAGPDSFATTGLGLVHLGQDRRELLHALVARVRAACLLQVHPGAEHRAGVVEHDHSDHRVGNGCRQVARQFAA